MVQAVKTEILIQAPPHKIWQSLVQVEEYHKWNPVFTKGTGTIARVGDKPLLKLASGVSLSPEVTVFEVNKELRWGGVLLSNWIFGGSHYFVIESLPDGSCRLTHGEDFSGWLPWMGSWTSLFGYITQQYEALNQSLKARAESPARD
ncbi:hypothetical protein HDU91_007502 [Kappamyces sp. JEL0680]|nr:hypothetical protein HDU91_007502 [Kappamyces sp. JEL0680]